MRILDRYILKSILSIFFTCLLTFLFLYIIVDVFSHLEDILNNKIATDILIQYYLLYLPIIFVQVAPIACLIATLYTFTRLNRDNEIIAMRSCGLSIFQIAKTAIVFGVIISIFIFWVNDRFVPVSLSRNQKIKEQMEVNPKKEEAKTSEVVNNLYMYGSMNRLFFVNKFFPATNTMEMITVLEHDEHQNITKKIVANKGVYKDGLWKFYKTITYEFDEHGQIKKEPQYLEEETMTISETPHDFLTQRQRPDLMNIAQLDDYIWKLSKSGARTIVKSLKVDFYQRFTMPLTSIIMIFLGIPFSFKVGKRAAGLSSIGLSIMLGFLYYVINAISIALGKAGILMPLVSASLSHVAAFFVSMYLISILP